MISLLHSFQEKLQNLEIHQNVEIQKWNENIENIKEVKKMHTQNYHNTKVADGFLHKSTSDMKNFLK
jgi:hypothetical protein